MKTYRTTYKDGETVIRQYPSDTFARHIAQQRLGIHRVSWRELDAVTYGLFPNSHTGEYTTDKALAVVETLSDFRDYEGSPKD